jgi:cytochrome c556
MKIRATLAAMLLGAFCFTPLQADEAQEKAIEYRQSVYTVVNWNFKPMGAMIKGEKPYNAAEFQRMAENVAFMSKLAAEGFIPGSDAKAGETEAKDDIWKKPDEFKDKMADFKRTSAELATASKSGDLNAIKPLFNKTADACKACHKAFRND